MDYRISHNAASIADAIARRDRTILQRVGSALHRGALETGREAQLLMPKFRSELATSTGVHRAGPLEQHITFNKRHAVYTEDGTKAGGRPPLAEMLDWIRLKNITPRDPTMSRMQLAHLIRRRIAERGVPAQPFAAPALDNKRERVNELVKRAIGDGMADGGGA